MGHTLDRTFTEEQKPGFQGLHPILPLSDEFRHLQWASLNFLPEKTVESWDKPSMLGQAWEHPGGKTSFILVLDA